MGVTIEELHLADDATRWAGYGFDVEDGSCRLGTVTVRLLGSEAGTGILSWTLAGLTGEALDGLPTERAAAGGAKPADGVEPADGAEPAGQHPNGVLALDHIVVVAPSFERTVQALREAGLDLRRIREEPTPAGAPRQAFFRLGREILEVVAEPAEVAERHGGPQRDAHFWGLALSCEDVAATAAHFGEHASAVRDAVQPGRKIASLRRSAGLAVPVALISTGDGAV